MTVKCFQFDLDCSNFQTLLIHSNLQRSKQKEKLQSSSFENLAQVMNLSFRNRVDITIKKNWLYFKRVALTGNSCWDWQTWGPQIADQIRIWKCWSLGEGGNWAGVPTEKPLGAKKRSKLNPHTTPWPGVKARPHWWVDTVLATVSSLPPKTIGYTKIQWITYLSASRNYRGAYTKMINMQCNCAAIITIDVYLKVQETNHW